VLRERYLLVHSTRSDAGGDELAEAVVAVLQRVLPQANALVSRTRDEKSLAGLLTTGQAVLAVLRAADAQELYRRDGGMLRRLLSIDARDLITVESFPRHHGWLVSAALLENKASLPIRMPGPGVVPIHSGSSAYARGEPLE
jgi:hypothetical protein